MKNWKCCVAFVLLLSLYACSGNIICVKKSLVSGTFDKEWAQGMAVYKDNAFLLNNTGLCRIYDLKSDSVIRSFKLGSYHKKNHANNASFGIEFSQKKTIYPVCYISEANSPYKCYVESISKQEAKLVQIIQYQIDGIPQVVHDWVVDKKRKKIYAITQDYWKNKDSEDYINYIKAFSLPLISEGDVIFSEKDVEEEFCVSFPHLLQGATIKKDKLYILSGLTDSQKNRKGYKKAIVVIDLKRKEMEKIISLQGIIQEEPEGIDFWKNRLLIFCGPKGLYELKLNGQNE